MRSEKKLGLLTRGRRLAFIVLFVVIVAAIIRGVSLDDIGEIITNASILCLSCIGIG